MSITKILISQPRPVTLKSPYFDLEERYGVHITFHPLIKIVPLTSIEYRQQKLPPLTDYNAFIFTSRHSADSFFHFCKDFRIPINMNWKYFCVSEEIANYLHKYIDFRKRKVFMGKGPTPEEKGKTFEELKYTIRKHPKERYFVPLGEGHNDEITDFLTQYKIKHAAGVMYRAVPNEFPEDVPFDFDIIALFTPAGVKSILELFPDFKQGDTKLVCFGPMTANAIEEAGLRLDMRAPTPEAPNIPAAIECFLKK